LERLEKACGVHFSEPDRLALTKLRASRNKLMHQGKMDDNRAMMARAASALRAILQFIEHEYKGRNLAAQVKDMRQGLLQFGKYGDKMFVDVKPEIENNSIP
jgi:hypothetical protein